MTARKGKGQQEEEDKKGVVRDSEGSEIKNCG
jgi:hypothetical protein